MFNISQNIIMLLVIIITKITINFVTYFRNKNIKNGLKGIFVIFIYDYYDVIFFLIELNFN